MSTSSRITLPLPQNLGHALRNVTAQKGTMRKGFNLRCAAGKTERVWLQGKGRALTPGSAFVLLPIKEGETEKLPIGYRASLRQALIDDNTGHANLIVCETDYKALKRGIEHLPPPLQ